MSTIFTRTIRPKFVSLVCFAILGSLLWSALSHAAIFTPGQSVPGVNGEVFGWTRGDANSTYSGWNVFSGSSGGIAPGTQFAPEFSSGSPSVLQLNSGGAFLTGGGNIYSFAVPVDFTSMVNTAAPSPGSSTRIVAQFRSLGTEWDYNSILLSKNTSTEGSIAPNFTLRTGGVPLGGFGGDEVDYLALWDLASDDVSALRIDFNSASSSLSLDQFHLDTFVQSAPFVTPSAVPEPGTLAMLGLIASGGWIGKRVSRRRELSVKTV